MGHGFGRAPFIYQNDGEGELRSAQPVFLRDSPDGQGQENMESVYGGKTP
jgi:hypothetical protein